MTPAGDKPICYDGYCGLDLGQSQFLLGANALVEKFVACRAQNPNHVGLSILNLAARAFTLILGPVGKLDHARFSARLAGLRNIGIPSTQTDHHSRILEFSAAVVDLLNFRLLLVKSTALTPSGLLRAKVRAVPTITRRGDNIKVIPTDRTFASISRYIILLSASPSPLSGLASC